MDRDSPTSYQEFGRIIMSRHRLARYVNYKIIVIELCFNKWVLKYYDMKLLTGRERRHVYIDSDMCLKISK